MRRLSVVARSRSPAPRRPSRASLLAFVRSGSRASGPTTAAAGSFEPIPYQGHDGLREALGNLELAFEDIRFDAEEFLDAGDEVVVFLRMRARGKESGVEVDARIAHLWTLRNGKGVRVRVFDGAEALEAAALDKSVS